MKKKNGERAIEKPMVRHHVTFSQEIIYHAHEPKLRKNVQHPLSPRFTLDRPVLIFIYSSSFSLSLFIIIFCQQRIKL